MIKCLCKYLYIEDTYEREADIVHAQIYYIYIYTSIYIYIYIRNGGNFGNNGCRDCFTTCFDVEQMI